MRCGVFDVYRIEDDKVRDRALKPCWCSSSPRHDSTISNLIYNGDEIPGKLTLIY